METLKKFYRVDRKEIAFLKFIFEAYDGIAIFSTIDSSAGIVVFKISQGCEKDVEMILQDLKKDILIEAISREKMQALYPREKYVNNYE